MPMRKVTRINWNCIFPICDKKLLPINLSCGAASTRFPLKVALSDCSKEVVLSDLIISPGSGSHQVCGSCLFPRTAFGIIWATHSEPLGCSSVQASIAAAHHSSGFIAEHLQHFWPNWPHLIVLERMNLAEITPLRTFLRIWVQLLQILRAGAPFW